MKEDALPAAPLLIQGAMDVETDWLIDCLSHPTEEWEGAWRFVRGEAAGRQLVVSVTGIGMANAAAATALAVRRYRPRAILNQGTAGGYHPDLHRGDLVLGREMVNLGAFSSPHRDRGAGVCPEQWTPFPVSVGRPGEGRRDCYRLEGDRQLLQTALEAAPAHHTGRVAAGVLGTADQWNREVDRIRFLHETLGVWAEEMETFAAAQVAAGLGVPFLGLRILSNHELHGEGYDRTTGLHCQRFVLEVARRLNRSFNQEENLP